ncbi:MAG TPA: hypothetical protein PLY45_02645 [bacterium]|nr:hypothetical protein [bacterium]
MKSIVLLAACVLFAAASTADDASAKGKKPPKKSSPQAAEEKAYEPTPPSVYCLEHPSQCAEKDPDARPASQPFEHCVDVYGNGDGFVSVWEMRTFGTRCRD